MSRPLATIFAALTAVSLLGRPASAGMKDFLKCSGAGPLGLGGPVTAQDWRYDIMVERNPVCAERLLNGDTGISGARIDQAKDPDLFRVALELKDLDNLLAKPRECIAIRLGLDARPTCLFCQSAADLEAWARRHLFLIYPATPGDDRLPTLRACLYDWDQLQPQPKEWLEKSGQNEVRWSNLGWAQRRAYMSRWGTAIHDRIMAAGPAQSQAANAWFAAYGADMTLAQIQEAGARLKKIAEAISSLQAARKLVATDPTPRARALLARAEAAGGLDARLSALSSLFDGLNDHRSDLSAVAPNQAGQRFDRDTRQVFAEVLGREILDETRGTWAGEGDPRGGLEGLLSFYARVPLVILIKPAPVVDVAYYQQGKGSFVFNETYIENYARSEHVTIRQLLSDPVKRRDLARLLAPIFVHEAQHHRQDLWAQSRGVPMASGEAVELEAMQVEALFTIQKSRDPAFRAAIDGHRDSDLAADDADLADNMRRLGPAGFRTYIRTRYYVGFPSLESLEWIGMDRYRDFAPRFRDEIARRRGLSAAAQRALRDGPPFAASYRSEAAFSTGIKSVGTPYLEQAARVLSAANAEAQPSYEAWRARMNRVDAGAQGEYGDLMSGRVQWVPRRRTDVPTPGAPR